MPILKSKIALNFDLNNSLLKVHYPSKNYKNAWKDIYNYLINHGFIHRQYSGYISNEAVSMIYVTQTITDMSLILDWLQHCVKEFDVTLIGDEFSLKQHFQQENNFIKYV
nr:hypothetical protein [uncultured Faecalibacillus sp.]